MTCARQLRSCAQIHCRTTLLNRPGTTPSSCARARPGLGAHDAGQELGVRAGARGQERRLIHLDRRDVGGARRVLDQRPAVVARRPHHGVPADPEQRGDRGHVQPVLTEWTARLLPDSFGQRRSRSDLLAGLAPRPDQAFRLGAPPQSLEPAASPAGPPRAGPAPAPPDSRAAGQPSHSPDTTPLPPSSRPPARARQRPTTRPTTRTRAVRAWPFQHYRRAGLGPADRQLVGDGVEVRERAMTAV